MLHFARWKIILVLVVAVGGILFALPNLFPQSVVKNVPTWLPHRQINLGLDLQGGAHLLFSMDVKELVADWLKNIRGDVRDALRKERIGYTGLRFTVANRSVQARVRKLEDADKAFKRLERLSQPVGGTAIFGGNVAARTLKVEKRDGGLIILRLTDSGLTQRVNAAIEASIETMTRRVNALGTTEPIIQRQGRDRVLLQVPGIKDVRRLKDLVGKTGKLEFRLVDGSVPPQEALAGRPPPGSEVLMSDDDPPIPYVIKQRTMVSGESLVDAQPGFDQQTNEPVVTFRFDSSGAKRFGRVTQQNVGRPFAIVLDNKVISAPVIREPILGGSGQISGNFQVTEANDLAVLLRSGALPAKLTIIEERTVGASLGEDSIAAGKIAAVIGMVGVVAFILLAYGLFGFFANLALAVNVALIFGTLSAIEATLTLPGIAGIVLTMGMAVDANVLIFERIREEARAGKTVIAAIDAGYSRALSTILDANITTFIAAVILFWLGSGPIRGFAVTLSVGIITSVFTAFTVTRLMVSYWVMKRRPDKLPF